MTNLRVEYILLFVVAAFLLYHLANSCGCGNGFRVGGQPTHLSRTRQDAIMRTLCNSPTYNPNTISHEECCRRFSLRCPQQTIGSGH